MKCIVLLTALIALLSCGSDSNLISPDPSMDMEQSVEKNEPPVVEDPLVELPDIMVEILNQDPPVIRVLDPDVIAEILNQDPPEVPEIFIQILNEDPPIIRVLAPDVMVEIQNQEPPELPDVIAEMLNQDPPEVPEIIVEILNEDPDPPLEQ